MHTWIGIEGKQHAFVHGSHGISRISACGVYPHPDLPQTNLSRDEGESLPNCVACDLVLAVDSQPVEMEAEKSNEQP